MKTKEAIRKRIIQYIKLIWGVKNINHLNPLTHLMIEEICNELYLLDNRLEDLDSSVLNKLVRTLSPPAFNYIRPSHGILKIDPSVPVYKLGRHTNFVLKDDASEGNNALQVSYAPIIDAVIFDVSFIHLFCDRKLWKMDSRGQRKILNHSNRRGPYNTMWLGIDVGLGIETLKGISLYLDFEHLPDHHPYYDLLSEATWTFGGQPLEMSMGVPVNQETPPNKIEREILDFYQDHFQTIQSDILVEDVPKVSLPEELMYLFDGNVPNTPLYWLSITFPESFLPEDIEKLHISFNAFSVVNRSFNRNTVTGKELESTVTLFAGMEQEFLEIESVTDSHGHAYFAERILSTPGTYTVEAVKRKSFDDVKIVDYLERLVDILHDERAAFPEIDDSRIMRVLDSVSAIQHTEVQRTGLNRLKKSAEVASLYIKPHEDVHTVQVSYWTTLAERLNGIPKNTQLMASKIPELNKSNAVFLTETIGGRNFYDQESARAISSFYLTSKGRVLTKNHILDFCKIELGSYIEKVDVVRKAVIGHKQKEGIIIVMEIQVTPRPEAIEYLRQKSVFKDLLIRLYRISPGHFNYRIKLLA